MCGVAPSCIKIVCETLCRACKSRIILFFNNDAYLCPVIEHVAGLLAFNFLKKYGPRVKDAVNPPHTVTFGEWNGTVRLNTEFLASEFNSCEY